jgi:hypothetical protein
MKMTKPKFVAKTLTLPNLKKTGNLKKLRKSSNNFESAPLAQGSKGAPRHLPFWLSQSRFWCPHGILVPASRFTSPSLLPSQIGNISAD